MQWLAEEDVSESSILITFPLFTRQILFHEQDEGRIASINLARWCPWMDLYLVIALPEMHVRSWDSGTRSSLWHWNRRYVSSYQVIPVDQLLEWTTKNK